MSRYLWATLTVPFIIVAACTSDTKPKDVLAQDTAFAREIAKAEGDTGAVLTDLRTGRPAAVAPASVTTGKSATGSSTGQAASDSRNASLVRTAAAGTISRARAIAPPAQPVNNQRRSAPARASAGNATTGSSRRTATIPSTPARRASSGGTSTGDAQAVNGATGDPAPANPVTTSSANRSGSNPGAGMIPAGSNFSLSSNAKVCTNTNKVGQTFSATVSESVAGTNGAMIPAGARAMMEITDGKRGENASDAPILRFRLVSVASGGRNYPVDGTATSATIVKVRNQPRNRTAQKVLGGAAVGAVVGQILGKDAKSTVAGAAAGAAVGAAAGAATAAPVTYDACLPSGGRINATLNSAARVSS